MKALRLRAALWLALALGVAIACTAQFAGSGGARLQTNLLALLPPTERNPVSEYAVGKLAEAAGNRAVFLVGERSSTDAAAAARLLAAELRRQWCGHAGWPSPPLLQHGQQVSVKLQGRQVQKVSLQGGTAATKTDSFKTKGGHPIRWHNHPVAITYEINGSSDIPGSSEFAAMDEVFQTWRDAISDCSYLRFDILPPAAGTAKMDGVNLVKWHETHWCKEDDDDDDGARCYPTDASAITTLYHVDDANKPNDGEILDADIVLNGVNFTWTIMDPP